MTDQNYPYPSPTTQLEQLAGVAQQASSPSANFSPNQRPPNPRKRRADGTSASSRGVANLTPDQLAKKRANDREAQRAIRERTRNNIEGLEARIKELESQQPFQDLQSVIRARDAVIAENEELKRRLQNITAPSQFQAGTHGLNDLALATAQQAPLPMPSQQQQQPEQQQQQDFSHDYEESGTSTPSMSQQHIHPDLRGLQTPQAPTAQMHMSNGASTSPRQPHRQNIKTDIPVWQRLPAHSEPTNVLESVILDLISSCRTALQAGETLPSVIGSPLPSFAALLTSAHPQPLPLLTKGITDIVTHHLGSSDLPKRVAMMYTMHFFLQWLISPTQEMYDRLPEWLRPTESQLDRPHPVWIDVLPWPQIRDRAMSFPDQHPLSFFYTSISSMSLEWPYDENLCLMRVPNSSNDADASDWVINPVFEAHVRDLQHWALASSSDENERDGRDEGLEGLLQGLGSGSGAAD